MPKVGRPILIYDEHQLYQNEIERMKEIYKEQLETGEITEEEINTSIYSDYDLTTFYFQNVAKCLTEVMQRKNKTGVYWLAKVENFGWQMLSGRKYFEASNGYELLQNVLPKTHCTFTVFNYGKGLAIQNYHHDSPVGREWYYLTPVTYNEKEDDSWENEFRQTLQAHPNHFVVACDLHI